MTAPQLFIPLHVHSDYSIMDGLQSVGAIAKRAAEAGFPAIALTDMSNVCGFIKFYEACKKAGVKPIMGADITVRENPKAHEQTTAFKLTILAMDRDGRQNLYDILSNAWLRSDAGAFNAWTSLEELSEHNKGLIVLNGFRGDIAMMLRQSDFKGIEKRTLFYKEVFGDRFCFEITRTNRAFETEFERCALDLCLKHNIPPVASNDTVFLYGEEHVGSDGYSDYQIHDVRVAIQRGLRRGDKDMARLYSKEQYLKSPAQMIELFSDLPEAVLNTLSVAKRCNVELELDHPRLPHYPTGDLSDADYLRSKARKGLEERLDFLFPDENERTQKRPLYEQRLETELDVIINMNFQGYFLIVMEFIQWSKDHGVSVGPGRGSGGGSLVAYSLKITDFDPIRFDLLFERFLNPERVSMPDFDIDFCQRNREKTLEHVRERYGSNAVSQIAAFGTMAPKAAIKDAGRALGLSYGAVDYVAKQLPAMPGLTFNGAMGKDAAGMPCESTAPDFLALYNKAVADDDKARIELIHIAMRLEGVIRNIGKHAAGVVISPTRTAEFTPLMLDSEGNSITQFDKKDVEHAGLVKFDFLGLTTLTIIADALEMINQRRLRQGQEPLDIHAIPYEDPASFKALEKGESAAVFQLESAGMRKLIAQLRPDRFDDLIALVALYRPGPIKSGMVDHFVQRKHGREPVTYPSPDFQDLDLKPILESTYGVIVYQEQVMQIAQVLAGYSLGGADILRRAMGKKNPAEMAGQRSVFREGAVKKGKDPETAMKIFDQVEMFAEYGFNKSHSAAYALVAWWTLYLKTHYPAEFLASMMTAEMQHTEKLVGYIAECRRLGIKVNPPDVSVGCFNFTVNAKGEIVYGLGAVKGVGEAFVNQIVAARTKEGPFKDFYDFAAKIGSEYLNKRTLEALIMSGAFDGICDSRSNLMASCANAVRYARQQEHTSSTGQLDLLSILDDPASKPAMVQSAPWPKRYQLLLEKNVLGLYLSAHPIDAYQSELLRFPLTRLCDLKMAESSTSELMIAGVVTDEQERYSKQDGSRYFVVTLDDATSQFELMLYGNNADIYAAMLHKRRRQQEEIMAVQGKDSINAVPSPHILLVTGSFFKSKGSDNALRFRIKELNALEQLRRQRARSITLQTTEKRFNANRSKLKKLLGSHLIDYPKAVLEPQSASDENNKVIAGCTLSLILDNTRLFFSNNRFRIDPDDELMDGLRDLFGEKAPTVGYQ